MGFTLTRLSPSWRCQYDDLMAQSKDLGVLIALAYGQETDGGEQIHHGEIDQTDQHG
jgi:hypothetical protein